MKGAGLGIFILGHAPFCDFTFCDFTFCDFTFCDFTFCDFVCSSRLP
ncbi:hypothetical protein [Lactiplantibacillus pentosus]